MPETITKTDLTTMLDDLGAYFETKLNALGAKFDVLNKRMDQVQQSLDTNKNVVQELKSLYKDSNVVLKQKDFVDAKIAVEKKVSGPIADSFMVHRKEEQVVRVINTSYDVDAIVKDKAHSKGVEARIAASKAKAAAFASFLKTEREKNKPGSKFIKANIDDMRVRSKGDSTPAINLGDTHGEVENGGVEHYSVKDSSPAHNLGDHPREVENNGMEHYSVKDSSPAHNLADHPRDV
jgi:hypothetical protein